MSKCRACDQSGTLRLARPRGFWEEHVLRRLKISPLRCVACGTRRLRYNAVLDTVGADRDGVEERPQVTFLEADAEGDFDDLVEEIRSSEQGAAPPSGQRD